MGLFYQKILRVQCTQYSFLTQNCIIKAQRYAGIITVSLPLFIQVQRCLVAKIGKVLRPPIVEPEILVPVVESFRAKSQLGQKRRRHATVAGKMVS